MYTYMYLLITDVSKLEASGHLAEPRYPRFFQNPLANQAELQNSLESPSSDFVYVMNYTCFLSYTKSIISNHLVALRSQFPIATCSCLLLLHTRSLPRRCFQNPLANQQPIRPNSLESLSLRCWNGCTTATTDQNNNNNTRNFTLLQMNPLSKAVILFY